MHASSSAPLHSPISKQADRPCAGASASPCLHLQHTAARRQPAPRCTWLLTTARAVPRSLPHGQGAVRPAAPLRAVHAAAARVRPSGGGAARSALAAAPDAAQPRAADPRGQRGAGHGGRRQREHAPAQGPHRHALPAADVLPPARADRGAPAARAGRRRHRAGEEDAAGARGRGARRRDLPAPHARPAAAQAAGAAAPAAAAAADAAAAGRPAPRLSASV